MNQVRLLYRLRQFWRTLWVKANSQVLEPARALLTPAQWELFAKLQPGEQHHALVVMSQLLARGEKQPELLVAALLHDIGKLHYPQNPLERAMVVLVNVVMPELAHRLGNVPSINCEELPWWRKAFVLAEQHARWGAELARQAGVSPLTEALIRDHQNPHRASENDAEFDLLQKLWLVDNKS